MQTRKLMVLAALLWTLPLVACGGKEEEDATALLLAAAAANANALPAGFIGACTVSTGNQGATKNYCNETFLVAGTAESTCTNFGNTWSATTRCSTTGMLATCKSAYSSGSYNLGYFATSISQTDCNGQGGTTNVLSTTVQAVP